jgi:predicted MFS family arabinose efflux permease
LLTTAITSLGLGALYFSDMHRGGTGILLMFLLLPTIAVAFSDVVIDALMVEKGQPLGLTGLLQSAQWTAMYAGMIVAFLLGGYLSESQHQEVAFLICAMATFVTLVLVWIFVPEQPRPRQQSGFAEALSGLRTAIQSPAVRAAALFVTLWAFNPVGTTVLYYHVTGQLALGEQFFGVAGALLSVGAMLGSLAYGTYCRKISFKILIHLSIVAGILSAVAYWGMRDRLSVGAVNFIVGFTYMTGNLVQLDLVARVCPLKAAGTTFALLMGLTNMSLLAANFLGTQLYGVLTTCAWDPTTVFNLLALIAALTNAACWLVVPLVKKSLVLGSKL